VPDEWGIEPRWFDVSGHEHVVADATITHLRDIIGTHTGAGPIVVRTGTEPPAVGRGELVLEDGTALTVDDALPPDLPLGYHSFRASAGGSTEERRVIVSPGRCRLPTAPQSWGWAAQLYATRSQESWGIGDFGDLATLARWSAACGAGFVLVNPLGATHPVVPQQPSPYFPASRRFLNPIYLRVGNVPGARDATAAHDAVERADAAGLALNGSRVIDRDEIWTLKLAALEAIWTSRPALDQFDRWHAEQPETLERFAAWCALVEQHGREWRDWPNVIQTPAGARSQADDDRARDRARFYAWLQWLASQQLRKATDGTAVALLQDLPIGVDPSGFDAWEWQGVLASGVTVGAPPDEFNTRGQNWGLPPFIPGALREADYQPFIETIRASMAPGGGLRIDHVMGLFRLWWVPEGNDPGDGAYVRYPGDDLLAIVALESERAGAFVVGEDLGTVEDSVRAAMAEHDVLSYRLLWFEEHEPPQWPAAALGAVTTHDLPTVVGLWSRSDLAEQRAAELDPNEASAEAMRSRLAERANLADDATNDDAVIAAHDLLGRAPCRLLAATLDDAVGAAARPNMPGADEQRPNWSLALPEPLEAIVQHPLATRVAARLSDAVKERNCE
jgi:4-alpha-glucanotransferase